MTMLFYLLDEQSSCPADATLPDGTELRVWRPLTDGPPRAGRSFFHNLVWWAFTRAGVFARPDFAELTLWSHGRLAHRLIVTPRWRRFPFMAPEDLQLGDLWTHPQARGRGLARLAIATAHQVFGSQARRFWYVVEAGNTPSIRLVERCGYRLAGRGRRTSPLGIRSAGRFVLEPPAA